MEAKAIVTGRKAFVPACSVSEAEGLVTVRLEMPGVPKEALSVKVEGNELSVFGEREREAPKGRYLVRERRAEAYRKLFTLDETIDHERVEASLENGLVVLKLHLKEAAKPRRIEIA